MNTSKSSISQSGMSASTTNVPTLRPCRRGAFLTACTAVIAVMATVGVSAAFASNGAATGSGLGLVAAASPDLTMPASQKALPIPTQAELAVRSQACTFQERSALTDYSARIAEADSIEEARALARRPSKLARRALVTASWVAPRADSLSAAKQRLERFEGQLAAAATPRDVAHQFDALTRTPNSGDEGMSPIQLADLNVDDVQVSGPGGCHYSTGEIIAVVIGFILFIIPGILLMVVLC